MSDFVNELAFAAQQLKIVDSAEFMTSWAD